MTTTKVATSARTTTTVSTRTILMNLLLYVLGRLTMVNAASTSKTLAIGTVSPYYQ